MLFCCTIGQSAYAVSGSETALVAFSGNEARNFKLRFDQRLVKTVPLQRYGLVYERYQQYFADALVLGSQLTLLKNQNGDVEYVVGHYYPKIISGNIRKLSPADAATVVNDNIGGNGRRKIDLMINPESGTYFYRIETRRADNRWFHWVDTESGKILNSYDGLMHGSGTGVLGDTKDLTALTTLKASSFQLISTDGRQTTYDARNRNRLPGSVATDEDDLWITAGSTSPGQPAMVDAQYYARITDNYYLSKHGFNWTDAYPQGMISSAHLQRNYNNAYWNGEQMAYGDGDGNSFIEFSGDLDVVGHELSHGVTEAFGNLIYQNESGALNEAFSDIMGTAIEYYYGTGNWTIGEDITVDSNGIRNMADPGEDGDPSHYDDRYIGTFDNGGVHINSGIANHWFYLLVNGGQNANPARASGTDVQGVGLAAAERITFLGFTALPANADFCDARASTVATAGSSAANVGAAWNEVGVDESLCINENPGDGPAPVISNVSSSTAQGPKFVISWDTDVPADSEVTFTCCGSYHDSALETNHAMSFTGSKGATYEYFVKSTDENGNSATAGPFIHNN